MTLPDIATLIQVALLVVPVVVLSVQVVGLLGGGDGWAFAKSLSAFFFGLLVGGIVVPLIALWLSSKPLHPLVIGLLALGGGVVGGWLAVERYWENFYVNVIWGAFLLGALAFGFALKWHVGMESWVLVVLIALVGGTIVGEIYWRVYLTIFPFIWIIGKTILITVSVLVLSVHEARYRIYQALRESLVEGRVPRELGNILTDHAGIIAALALASVCLALYAVYIQQFTHRWRELVVKAKARETNPQGGLIAGFDLALRSMGRTVSGMLTCRRVIIDDRASERQVPRPAASKANGAQRWHLAVYLDGRYVSVHPLASSAVVRLGRDAQMDIVVPHDMVSRHHLTIAASAKGLLVKDEGSSNGTWKLGKQKITVDTPNNGDWYQMGSSHILFQKV